MKKTPEGLLLHSPARNGRNSVFARILLFLILLPTVMLLFAGCGNSSEFVLPTRVLPENAEQQKYEDLRYKIYDDDTVLLTEYRGESAEVVIPDEIEGRRVVALNDSMFYQNKTVTSIRLGKYVESIGVQCFTECSNLANIELNDALWSVGEFAFSGTPWLDALLDPSEAAGDPSETDAETAAETTESTDPADDFLIVGNGILLRYLGKDKNVVIPDTVKHIADAFLMCDIISVEMGDSVCTIGGFSFAFCTSLSLVEFSPNLVSIGNCAFYGCAALPSVILPEKLEILGDSVFYECLYLNNVRLNDALRSIGTECFYNCSQLRTLYLPLSVTSLPAGAFGECLALELVFYAGDEKAFKAITTDTSNYPLLDATIVYNASSGG